jgi:hypothetical protein
VIEDIEREIDEDIEWGIEEEVREVIGNGEVELR